jgi:hypothetical protein
VLFAETEFPLTFAVLKKVKIAHRGVVERFIAPVLKTGEPLRVPGVRIPPPLPVSISKVKKACKSYDFRLFAFRGLSNYSTNSYLLVS